MIVCPVDNPHFCDPSFTVTEVDFSSALKVSCYDDHFCCYYSVLWLKNTGAGLGRWSERPKNVYDSTKARFFTIGPMFSITYASTGALK